MSSDAVGWTFRHSPYRDTPSVFAVHLAVADSVNDQHNNELWMTQTKVARKARCSRQAASRALIRLVDEGFLELVEDNSKAGKANRYRFLFPREAEVVYEARWDAREEVSPDVTPGQTEGVTTDDTPVSPDVTPVRTAGVTTDDTGCNASGHRVSPGATPGVTPGDTEPKRTQEAQEEPKPPSRSPSPDGDDQPDGDSSSIDEELLNDPTRLTELADALGVSVDAIQLCRLFAHEHHQARTGHVMPKRGSANWRKWIVEMDRLLRLGPRGGDGDPAVVPDAKTVATVIRWCVADDFEQANVASVPKLRKRWSQLRLKALNTSRPWGAARGADHAAKFRQAAAEVARREAAEETP